MAARTVQARFPAGIVDSQRLKFAGIGIPGEHDGDLYVRMHVSPPPAAPAFKPSFGEHAVRWMLFYSLFLALGVLAGINFTGIWELLAWIWSASFATAGLATAAVITSRARDAAIARRYGGRFITVADLDISTRPLLVRAQNAIAAVLRSDVYLHNLIDKTANRVILREHEWEIAGNLQKISLLRAEVSRGRVSGPASSAVRASYVRDQDQAQLNVASRVEALEHYADQIHIEPSRCCEVNDVTQRSRRAFRAWRWAAGRFRLGDRSPPAARICPSHALDWLKKCPELETLAGVRPEP